jgi:hypothetical protein
MAWQVKRSRASDAHVRALLADVDAADSALSAAAAAVKGVLPPREVAVAPAASAADGAEVAEAGAGMEERRQLSPHTMVDGESGGYGCLLCVFTRLLHSGACVMCSVDAHYGGSLGGRGPVAACTATQ